jgi:hypothetical protein
MNAYSCWIFLFFLKKCTIVVVVVFSGVVLVETAIKHPNTRQKNNRSGSEVHCVRRSVVRQSNNLKPNLSWRGTETQMERWKSVKRQEKII